jgi:hypothetical protein
MMRTDGDPFLAAFCRLAVREGLTLGALHGGRRADFLVVTAAAALALARGREYTEAEVNTLLRDWLAGPGAMLSTDHVELRRWLVDCGLLVRDGYGRRYARNDATGEWTAVLAALDGADLSAEAGAARAVEAARRSERKASWELRAGTAAARE